jgi:predicted alpha/beta superfamily hydrolase
MDINNLPAHGRQILGEFQVMEEVSSKFLHRSRSVTVWFPPSYRNEPERCFPVLYMHDGQQVLDPATSTNGVSWDLDGSVTRLAAAGQMDEVSVAAIDSTDARDEEYHPSHAGRNYARFVIEELKPEIDRAFRTLPDRTHTAVAGASMGGLISMYFAWVYPHIFGSAACLSSAFSREGNRFMLDMVRSSDITPDIRLYLYCGGGDEEERTRIKDHRAMETILAGKGLRPEKNLRIEENEKGTHDEQTWSTYTDHWLPFLFPAGGHPPSSIPF